MSDLLSLLSLGAAGIAAQNTGVSVATNNVANVNTDGYSRQRADLNSLPASPLIGGVITGQPNRVQDELLSGRIRSTAGSLANSRSLASGLNDLETALAGSGATLHEQLGTLFSRIGQVASAPSDVSLREAVLTSTREFIAGVRRRAAELADGLSQADLRIQDNAIKATTVAGRLAAMNKKVQQTNDPVLRDERDRLAKQLGELAGGTARVDRDGQMRVVLDNGAVLVDGVHAAKLVTAPDPSTGKLSISLVDGASSRDITTTLKGGTIGADLSLRDKTISGAIGQLDQFAYDVATKLNATHQTGAGLDGVTGRNMFVNPTAVTGAAASLAIDPALDADSTKLATGTAGAGPGDNRGALALFALATAPVATGGKTMVASALDIVSSIASQAADANSNVKRDELIDQHLAGLRDSLAGVDLQEEMANLSKFEHASSAMTRFVSTIDGLLGDLIDRL